MVRIRLLGGVGATTDGGEPVDIGPAKCQTVLAVLALSAGSAVPVPRLVELVWGEQSPRTAEKTLQSYVVRLRKGLGADSIVRIGAAYRLDLPADAVDVARFRRQLEFRRHRGGAGGVDRTPAGRARGPWPHPDGGRAGGAVAGRGGDRPSAPGPDRPGRDHRAVDRTHGGLSLPGETCGRC